MDNSTDKLRDHVCDNKGGGDEGVNKSEIFTDVIDGSPLIANTNANATITLRLSG